MSTIPLPAIHTFTQETWRRINEQAAIGMAAQKYSFGQTRRVRIYVLSADELPVDGVVEFADPLTDAYGQAIRRGGVWTQPPRGTDPVFLAFAPWDEEEGAAEDEDEDEEDFVDELIAEQEAATPGFAAQVDDALLRRGLRLDVDDEVASFWHNLDRGR